MDALGITEPVKRHYGIHWHCVLLVHHQSGRKRHSSSVSVSTGLWKKERPGEDFIFSPCMELLRIANTLAKPPEPCAPLAQEGQG